MMRDERRKPFARGEHLQVSIDHRMPLRSCPSRESSTTQLTFAALGNMLTAKLGSVGLAGSKRLRQGAHRTPDEKLLDGVGLFNERDDSHCSRAS